MRTNHSKSTSTIRSRIAPAPSTSDCTAVTDPTNLIDDYAAERIDYQVHRVGRVLHLSLHEREDLRQTLFLDLCKAMKRYDPTKSKPHTFMSRVVVLAAKHQECCIRKARRCPIRSPILLSQLQQDGRGFSPRAPRWCEPSAHDLTLDLPRGIAAMNRRRQQLAESLKTQTPVEVAAERRVHRSTVYRDIASMRGTLSELGLNPGG